MSLQATHIRFALDVKDKYQVKDIKKYICGTVYPDSRYTTKIDRTLTHNGDILLPAFAKDDFKKGWQVHQICDILQNYIFSKNIPLLVKYSIKTWEEPKWLSFTASKIIQDMADMQSFDIQKILVNLNYTYNPNSENIADVKKSNQIIINLYKDKKTTSSDDYYHMWLDVGMDKEKASKLKAKAKEFLKDKQLVSQIQSCYDKILKLYNNPNKLAYKDLIV
ncbi:MAG: hypothetical protein NT135_00775 [Candidatus Berkelbacteria bacterium]|nr:hypothetical protein [Candidatus Berkelbacteria bacterium]